VPGQIREPAPAVGQRLLVLVPDAGRERTGDLAPEPDQHRCLAGQRSGPGQGGECLAAAVERGGQPPGYQEGLHRRCGGPGAGEQPGGRGGPAQLLRVPGAGPQARLGGDDERPSPEDIEAAIMRAELRQALRDGLAELPERDQALLRLYALAEPYKDVAEILQMKMGSVGPTLRRCLDKLRQTDALRAYLGATLAAAERR
jgi:RNA polymerase sigma factor (sigma-70 family)